jgi:hypothetical protein
MTTAQLGFSLNNPDAANTVYISAEAAANQLTLAITTTAAASFAACAELIAAVALSPRRRKLPAI